MMHVGLEGLENERGNKIVSFEACWRTWMISKEQRQHFLYPKHIGCHVEKESGAFMAQGKAQTKGQLVEVGSRSHDTLQTW